MKFMKWKHVNSRFIRILTTTVPLLSMMFHCYS